MPHGPSPRFEGPRNSYWRQSTPLADSQLINSISNISNISNIQASIETPEEKRKRELEAYLKQGTGISYGPLGPSVSIRDADEAKAKDALLSLGVPLNIASPTATVGASLYDGLEKLTGGRSWHPGTGRSPYYPDSILTDVTGGGSIKGTWNY